jgi:hypothetical protein
MSVTANFSSSASAWRAPARCTSSERSSSDPNAASATPIVTTGPMTVSTIAASSLARIVTSAPSQPRQAGYGPRPVIVFVILGHAPVVLLVCLLGLLYLTWVELRGEEMEPQVKLWWGLLVLLTHVPGYLALRVWIALRRRRDGARRPA